MIDDKHHVIKLKKIKDDYSNSWNKKNNDDNNNNKNHVILIVRKKFDLKNDDYNINEKENKHNMIKINNINDDKQLIKKSEFLPHVVNSNIQKNKNNY